MIDNSYSDTVYSHTSVNLTYGSSLCMSDITGCRRTDPVTVHRKVQAYKDMVGIIVTIKIE